MATLNRYEATFKTNSCKLFWVHGKFTAPSEASEKLSTYIQKNYPNQGYNLYGGPLVQKTV